MIKSTKDLQKELYGNLAPYAVRESRGRKYPQKESTTRLPFQLDRDRIIHCKAFRRLDGKMQVVTPSFGDHYRTRLHHTLEVAQVSRDIARSFALNEDLSEAIALAHDLGHTPFGHGGQDALNEIMEQFGKHFEHNEQSRHIVEKVEKLYPDFDGLNLSIETLEGMVKHRTPWDNPTDDQKVLPSLESQIVNLADEIAYTNHDIDDGLRCGLFKLADLDKLAIWSKAKEHIKEKYHNALSDDIARARIISAMLHLMVVDLCAYSTKDGIDFSEAMKTDLREIREFLTKNFYFSETVIAQVEVGKEIIRGLFDYYYRKDKDEDKAKDYIAGMTDDFARTEYERLVKKIK